MKGRAEKWPTSIEELEQQSRDMASDAFKAASHLVPILALEHLSSDVYQDVSELIDKLHVRAGHAEGEYISVENYVIPIQAALSQYYENLEGWEANAAGDEAELRGMRIAVVSILDLIRRATGLELWPHLPHELDPEELESYF